MADYYEPPSGFGQLCKLWRSKFTLSKDSDNRKSFDEIAKECNRYYQEAHDFIYEEAGAKKMPGFSHTPSGNEGFVAPTFKMTFNKVAELVQLVGPILYHRNPVRRATSKTVWQPPTSMMAPPMPGPGASPLAAQMGAMSAPPMDNGQAKMLDQARRARAEVQEIVLNYTPNELNLKAEMRLGTDEALVKGRGCIWTELYHRPIGQRKLVGHFFHSVDDLLIDPDAKRLEDAKWIARRCIRPIWEVERKYGLRQGTIKAEMESTAAQASVSNGSLSTEKKKEGTTDLVTYWEVWSKMGLGPRLKNKEQTTQAVGEEVAPILDAFGDYVYMVIASKCNYPLNLKPEIIDGLAKVTPDGLRAWKEGPVMAPNPMTGQMEQMPLPPEIMMQVQVLEAASQAVKWPIPFWADETWPVEVIDFHPLFNTPWPMNHLAPAMGEQNFLDWAYSFLAGKIKTACRTFLAIPKGSSEEIKEAVLNGGDFSLLEMDLANKSINEVVQFVNHPQFTPDVYTVIQAIERNFEKRTGLSEMMYGQTATQSRSAADAATKGQMLQIRPDDMANIVEDVASNLARKEAIANRLLLRADDVIGILGPYGAQFWDAEIATEDLELAVSEFDYRIEASSARKPNKDLAVQNTQEGIQFLVPVLQGFAQTYGQWGPILAFLREWAKAREFDIEPYLLDEAQLQQMQQAMQQQQAMAASGPPSGPPAEGGAPPPEGAPPMPMQQPMPAPAPPVAMDNQQIVQLLMALVSISMKMQMQPAAAPAAPQQGARGPQPYIERQQLVRDPSGLLDHVDKYFIPASQNGAAASPNEFTQ